MKAFNAAVAQPVDPANILRGAESAGLVSRWSRVQIPPAAPHTLNVHENLNTSHMVNVFRRSQELLSKLGSDFNWFNSVNVDILSEDVENRIMRPVKNKHVFTEVYGALGIAKSSFHRCRSGGRRILDSIIRKALELLRELHTSYYRMMLESGTRFEYMLRMIRVWNSGGIMHY